ncbi:MAG TPA: bb3-type cytochrome oxidase subunit III [Burkholderiaceae bacterium]|jgi:cytochrome c oxidase subunit 3
MNTHVVPQLEPRPSNLSTALWLFIIVASMLFALFITAYVMRTAGGDWSGIALPWQLALSTALLVMGSLTMQLAAHDARLALWLQARFWLYVGGACAAAFLGVQLWAWTALQAAQVRVAPNPAASFFYLLTAMHGLHVLGGLVAWDATTRGLVRESLAAAETVRLCARYWHFLLAAWLALLATLGGATPAFIGWICGSGAAS